MNSDTMLFKNSVNIYWILNVQDIIMNSQGETIVMWFLSSGNSQERKLHWTFSKIYTMGYTIISTF